MRTAEYLHPQSLQDGPAPGASRKDEDLWQNHLFVGYHINRNLFEVSAGVLNLADTNYRLCLLSPYFEIAHERTLVIRFRARF